jgi:hypothetical protein
MDRMRLISPSDAVGVPITPDVPMDLTMPHAPADTPTRGEEFFRTEGAYTSLGAPIPGGQVGRWLLREGSHIESIVDMFDELCWRLVADRLPLLRATLHMGTLHPLTRSTGIRWLREPKIIEEYRVLQGQEATDEYLRSPIRVTTEAKDAVDPKPTPTQAQSSRSGHLRRSRNTAVQDVGNPDGPPQCHS